MSYAQVLEMPVRLFWAMDSCISRVQAHGDIRAMGVGQSSVSAEAAKTLHERLTLELGETVTVKRSAIVEGDPDRKAKFARIMR